MKHFYEQIQGWFDYQNHYSEQVKLAKDGDHFVEVGAWKGRSAAYMAVEILNSQKKIQFDCVDTWLGSEEHQQGQQFEDQDVIHGRLYEAFIWNMKPVEGLYKPIKMTSVEAAELYPDSSLNFVFLDAAHDYDSIRSDILAWLPKIQPGGWLGGHDYTWNEGIRRACKELLPNHQNDPSWDWTMNVYRPEYEHQGVSWMYQKPLD